MKKLLHLITIIYRHQQLDALKLTKSDHWSEEDIPVQDYNKILSA
jgi:hypothetical protein